MPAGRRRRKKRNPFFQFGFRESRCNPNRERRRRERGGKGELLISPSIASSFLVATVLLEREEKESRIEVCFLFVNISWNEFIPI